MNKLKTVLLEVYQAILPVKRIRNRAFPNRVFRIHCNTQNTYSYFSEPISAPERVSRYALTGHMSVEGWLGMGAVSTIIMLDALQQDSGVRGGVCEIGVHHGRLFILLALLRLATETALAIDVFENQQLNVDFSGLGNREMFWKNVDRCIGTRANIITLCADSLTLSPNDLLNATKGESIRLFSVDGGHTTRHLLSDLQLASKVLSPGGIVIVDDFYNADWPGVNEGVVRYLLDSPALLPFCYGDNKLYLCHRDEHSDFLDWTHSILVPRSHYSKEVELCGKRAFHCQPPAPQNILRLEQ